MSGRKRAQGRTDGNASFSSSDSDEGGRCSRRKKRTCAKEKKKAPCEAMAAVAPCFSLRKRLKSCWKRFSCGDSCMSPTNSRCFLFYGIALLLLGGLIYWNRYLVMGVLQRLFLSSYFKSTSTIVDEALARYNADKLGLADYALESAGGSILCSSNTFYSRNGALYSIFGVPLWYHSSSPREVIQPDVQPGKCWAMDGSKGYIMIQLSMPVMVTAISLEHIPAQVAPSGRIDSAPKDFSIIGKESNMDSPDIHLGTFFYNSIAGNPIQSFEIKDPYCTRQSQNPSDCGPNEQIYRIIELRILSNYGNPDYTCIYRLRVHGKPISQVVAEQKYHGQPVHAP